MYFGDVPLLTTRYILSIQVHDKELKEILFMNLN
jgi:hypothetical protein